MQLGFSSDNPVLRHNILQMETLVLDLQMHAYTLNLSMQEYENTESPFAFALLNQSIDFVRTASDDLRLLYDCLGNNQLFNAQQSLEDESK